VIALESALRHPEPGGELMELDQRGVAHHVAPEPIMRGPDRRVDEDHEPQRTGRAQTTCIHRAL
jgi:hypothetical protein